MKTIILNKNLRILKSLPTDFLMPLVVLLVLLIAACQNTRENKLQESLTKDSLIKINRQLQNELREIESLNQPQNNQLTQSVSSNHEETKQTPDDAKQTSTKYAFVILHLTKKVYDFTVHDFEIREYISWSPIKEFSYFDNDTKYKFMDDFESVVRSRAFDLEDIKKRECFVFDSYAEASKHLENQKDN